MIIAAYGNAVPFTNTNNRISDKLFPPSGEPNHRWFRRFPLTFSGCRRGPTTRPFDWTHLRGSITTAPAIDLLQGHVSLERAQRAEAAPVCYRKSAIERSDRPTLKGLTVPSTL